MFGVQRQLDVVLTHLVTILPHSAATVDTPKMQVPNVWPRGRIRLRQRIRYRRRVYVADEMVGWRAQITLYASGCGIPPKPPNTWSLNWRPKTTGSS